MKLRDYDQFQGLHWETGTLRNYLEYTGVRAPHTGEPYSEAMLLGISGGIVMGYYTFDYQGYDPIVQILTRNTFDPLDRIYSRLGIQTAVYQTTSSEKGEQNLLDVLNTGRPAIVYADQYSLAYNALSGEEGMWAMLPILVYGYNPDEDQVWVADRSRVPLVITCDKLAAARGRTKANKYRLLIHKAPIPEKLPGAVEAGLQDCVRFFTQPPPKGSKHNFGFLAYEKWEHLLQRPNQRGSWEKDFAPGVRMFAGLKSAFESIRIYGKDGWADRDMFAVFLDEASIVISNPALKEIADQFRISASAWESLGYSLLPDEVPILEKTRKLLLKKHHLFLQKGISALDEMQNINDRLVGLRKTSEKDFPLNENQAGELYGEIVENISTIHDIEFEAVNNLQDLLNQWTTE